MLEIKSLIGFISNVLSFELLFRGMDINFGDFSPSS